MSALTVADVLDQAAAVIRRNGWHQGDYFDRDQLDGGRAPADCAVCAEGAINIAIKSGPDRPFGWHTKESRSAFRLYRIVEKFLGVGHLADWNDAEDRTYAEVLAALEGAARAERERAS